MFFVVRATRKGLPPSKQKAPHRSKRGGLFLSLLAQSRR
jgi:hypothetical protein